MTRPWWRPTWGWTRMPRLEVRDLHVSYGKVRALQGVTLTVEERQIVSIVGANGAGKSTVLKAIMGLVPVASGEMRFGDRRLDRMSPPGIVGAGVAICPEGRRLFPEMTVQENLMIGAYQRDSRRAALVLGEVYGYFPILTERKRQLAGSLSGGQQQMVAIGRALMSGPQLLLLVEQNARMALRLSDRAYVMETGRVTLSGTGQELLNNTQVQRFYLGL